MCLDPGRLFEQDAQGADIVVVDKDANVDELEMN